LFATKTDVATDEWVNVLHRLLSEEEDETRS